MRAAITVEALLAPASCDVSLIDVTVQNLIQIKNDLLYGSSPPVLEDDARSKLIAIGGFPCTALFHHNISKLERYAYTGKDVSRLVTQILEIASSISSVEPIHVADWEDVSMMPELCALAERKDEIKELMQSLALRGFIAGGQAFVVHHPVGEDPIISFNGLLSDIEPALIDVIPKIITNEIFVAGMYLERFLIQEPCDLFRMAISSYDIKIAYYVGVIRLLSSNGDDWTDFLYSSFSVGDSFIDSLHRNQCYVDQRYFGVCFESVVHLLAGMAKYPESTFKVAEGSTTQRKRNSDGAWRTHITKHVEALRLMYWKSPEGKIELANVGRKAELHIAE